MAHLVAFAFHQPKDIPDLTRTSRTPRDPKAAQDYAANKAVAAALNFRVAMAAQAKR